MDRDEEEEVEYDAERFEKQLLFENMDGGEVCALANIGKKERRVRGLTGVMILLISLAALLLLVIVGASRWWRIVLLPLYITAFISFLQMQQRTCIVLSLRKVRSVEGNVTTVEDDFQAMALRKRALKIFVLSLILGLVVTALSLLIPEVHL